MILIVGLGNPGKKFERTRHNVGFLVIDGFSRDNDFPSWRESKNNNCLYAKKEIAGKEIELIKPLVFMNNSGQVVKSISRKHNLKQENILIVHDDIDLHLGKIRIVKNRGSAGHKGVQSIIDEIGTKDFVRFRIGICPESFKLGLKDLNKFVIQKFNKEEGEIVKKTIENSCRAIEMALSEGLEKTKQEYNK
jgi:PTH1 family peptidyl-tRNA hydrolase